MRGCDISPNEDAKKIVENGKNRGRPCETAQTSLACALYPHLSILISTMISSLP